MRAAEYSIGVSPHPRPMSVPGYRGRFAPSPTGPLHFGSLVAALASYLDARAHRGQWLVRIEDLDSRRTVPGAAEAILRTLEALGLEWGGPVIRQGDRAEAYRAALDRLARMGAAFACACTRREIADSGLAGADGGRVYPGTCRDGVPPGRAPRAIRVRVDDAVVAFDDAVQGLQRQRLGEAVGDFVLRRADGLFAYQLAVVVDDAAQGITTVVRGADLLDSTPRQIFLQRLLGYATPSYLHVPVATNPAGEKLSKQTLAPAIDRAAPAAALVRALGFLGQPVPEPRAGARELLATAVLLWDRTRIPRVRGAPVAG